MTKTVDLPADIAAKLDERVASGSADTPVDVIRAGIAALEAEDVRKLDAAGAIMALGTDQSSGPAGHRELELITAGGVPALNAIRMATLNAARFLGRERDLGSIEEGKIADLVLLEADPIANINNAKRVNMVVKNGEVIDRSKLDLPVNRK